MADGLSYTDSSYDTIEKGLEAKYNLPAGGLGAIRTRGERSNADQVSSEGARSVYQIIPATRDGILKQYGVDAYANPAAAAEASALILRDSMRRNNGDWNKAVTEYIGGTNPANYGKTTRGYVNRVTGQPMIIPAGSNGATMLAPGLSINDLSYDDLKDVAPENAGSARPLGPEQKPDTVSKADRVTAILTNGQNLVAPRGDERPDLAQDVNRDQQAQYKEGARQRVSFGDELEAAFAKNHVLNQIIRGITYDHGAPDPAYHDYYLKNIDAIEKQAETPEERDRLRNTVSMDDLVNTVQSIEANRTLDRTIAASDHPTALTLGATLADPAGWAVTAGIGKAAQVLGKAPTLVRMATEGAVGNMALTGIAQYGGEQESAGDYLVSGLTGLGIGAALHGFHNARGLPDRGASDAVADLRVQASTEAKATLDEARGNLPADATPEQLSSEVQRLQVNKVRGVIEDSLADVGDENKFLTADEDTIYTSEPSLRRQQINKLGLDAIDDAGERAMVAEITYRAEQIAAANPIDEAGLQGRLLKSFNGESTGLTMLRSKSPVMKAVALQLLESTTGAGGRRRTAAMSQVVRERMYMRHMIEYDQMFDQWRNAQGKGWLESHLNPSIRNQFDREVFYEIENRAGRSKGEVISDNAAVTKAATLWEDGMELMAKEQRHVSTLGAQRLPESSVGYMRHVIDPRKVMGMTDSERRVVENVLAKQFNTLNEYRYIAKETGEKVTKTFDPKFSRELAKGYLVKAMRRGNGSLDIPVNIHDSGSAEIVESALEGMRNLDTAEKEAILGKFSRGGASYTKGRLKLDMNAPIGENRKLGDLFRQDIVGLYRGYARRASGEVALAQYGVYGKKGLDVMREAAERTGATPKELKAFDQVSAEFLNQPYRNAVRFAAGDNLRIATSAAKLGGIGFTQLGEQANATAAIGVNRAIASIGALPRMVGEVRALAKGKTVDSPILNSIDTLGGHLGLDDFQLTRMFDMPDNAVQLYNDQTVGLAGRVLRGGSHMVAVMSGHRILVASQVRGMSEQIVRKAIGYIREGKEDKALLDMGFTPEVQAAFKQNMDKIATFDKNGNLTKLDIMAGDIDPNLVMTFRDGVERGAGQIIQRTYTGETGAWAHNDFLKLLLQFRTFSLTSIEKQWGRNMKNYGAIRSFAQLMGAMSFALPIHMARVQAQMIGLSTADREKYEEAHMSTVALVRATMNYASASGVLGDVLDVSASFANNVGLMDDETAKAFGGGGRSGASVSRLVPGIGMADDVLSGTVGGQFKKLPKLLPGSNLPFITPLINGATADGS